MKLIKLKKNKINNIYFSNKYNNLIKILNNKKIFLLFDYNIYYNFFYKIKNIFKNFIYIIIPSGEYYKNINTLKIVIKYMIKNKVNNNYNLYCIGGGVINDLIGIISSIYFRGITYINIPTTLLSQIDSSIGGKNSINFFSKNSIGNIYFPKFIYINNCIIYFMKKKEFKDGFSEIIKYSLINNLKLFFYLLKKKNIKKIIFYSCYIKCKIISQDYYENNYRSCLNFGHTYGHCIENNDIKKYSHGESVILGIIFSIFISDLFYNFKIKYLFVIIKLINFFNFFITNKLKFNINMFNKLLLDKKFNNKINFIILKKIGFCNKKIIKKYIFIKYIKYFYEI